MQMSVDGNVHSPPPPPLPQMNDQQECHIIVNNLDLPPPPMSPTNSSISEDGDTWQTPTNKLSITDDGSLKGAELSTPEDVKSTKASDKNGGSNNGRLGRFLNSINKKFKTKDNDKRTF